MRDLQVCFASRSGTPVPVVRGVSFDLHAGRTLCLVGESGSGKSVSARAILQLIDAPGRINGGEIVYQRADGQAVDIAKLDARGRDIRRLRGAEIAMIFQEPMTSLSPVHTIGAQIVEAIRLHQPLSKADARAQAIELLRQVEIREPERAIDRYTFEYSGGMRQRAMIAMALACNPRVLIADEPTTALDVTTQAEILALMRRLQQSHGMAVLFITHDMGVVAHIADEVAVMHHGVLVEKGPVEQVFKAPQAAYSRRLIGSVLQLEQAATAPRPVPEGAVPLLQVQGLSKIYRSERTHWFKREVTEHRAVNRVNLTLYEGQTLGIVGESGSGKTTLGRAMLRLIEPDEGEILWLQRDGTRVPLRSLDKAAMRHAWREMRIVFQDPYSSLNPRMTVGQIVAEPLRVNRVLSGAALDRRVAELLEQVGLQASAAERYPHAFSGGQRQRIGIARALALNPRLILADEATSALDVSLRAQVLDLMLELRQRLNLSFVFISHDIAVIRYFCDRVAVMHRGELVEEGPTLAVTECPQHPYTQRLLSAVLRPDPGARFSVAESATLAAGHGPPSG
ncbi:MAG: ABC transporter ATP-binding protein [Rubrivivax sp.]|nr:ABC transporter ATP-binding protein [Rubrivivax sp.]